MNNQFINEVVDFVKEQRYVFLNKDGCSILMYEEQGKYIIARGCGESLPFEDPYTPIYMPPVIYPIEELCDVEYVERNNNPLFLFSHHIVKSVEGNKENKEKTEEFVNKFIERFGDRVEVVFIKDRDPKISLIKNYTRQKLAEIRK